MNKKDIMKYGFYNESKQFIVVLNEDKLKEIFKADIILLKEEYK